MTKIKYILIVFVCLAFINCKTEERDFPLDKRYWDLEDYEKAILELRFGYNNDEKKPTFDNPAERLIVQKLTDEQNFKIVLRDEELGLNHRNNVATKFFDHWRNMNQIYQGMDRKDNYIYDIEMLAVLQFGLGLQLDYFKLGNDQIKANADDPNAVYVQNNIKSNIRTLIDNYTIYLDEINNEKAFSEEGKTKLAKGLDLYFIELINLYPDADYSEMKKKAELMLKKSKSSDVKASLTKLMVLIDSKKENASL